jgi:hypothetical protein
MNPSFGTVLKEFIFEGITETNIESLKANLSDSISIYVPEITVVDIVVNPNTDYNLIELSVKYKLKISNEPDQVTVQFQ